MRSGSAAPRSSCKADGAGAFAAGAVGDGYLSGAPVRMSSRNETDGGRGRPAVPGALFSGIRFRFGSVVVVVVVGAIGGLGAV